MNIDDGCNYTNQFPPLFMYGVRSLYAVFVLFAGHTELFLGLSVSNLW